MPPLLFSPQRPDRRALDLEYRLNQENPIAQAGIRAGQDPAGTLGRVKSSLDVDSRVLIGRIVDLIPYAHFYKVQCERGFGTVSCCDMANTSLGIVGPRQVNTYSVGTQVAIIYHPQAVYGMIIGAIPDWSFDARHGVGDFIVQGSNIGVQKDNVHRYPFTMAKNGGIIDFSAGRPVDSVSGEWGVISETGIRVFLDSLMASVAVDEVTGLWLFYQDQLTRLAGHNLQIRSAGYDREDLDDESEFSSVSGWSPYPWETLGLKNWAGIPHVELNAAQVQQGDASKSRYEPGAEDQLGIYREREFHGYLGQGGLRKLGVPTGTTTHRYSVNGDLYGLAEESWGLDGTINLRSSRSIFIAKHPIIAEPKRKCRPEDPSGDTTNDAYASCGLFGAETHNVKASPTFQELDQHLVEPAAILDLLAYEFQWKVAHPFHYHRLDWYLPNDSELPTYSTMAASAPAFTDLRSNQYMSLPGYYTVKVDDRYGLVRYYANASFLAFLPSGGVVLRDGFGSEIRMTGGQIGFHAAGDIITTAGRSIIDWAGWDAIVKANNCVDLSANFSDVRIKANDKVMVTGGNNGCGGVIIECRADGFGFANGVTENVVSGIQLRAVRSGVAILSEEQHLIQYSAESRPTKTVIDGGEYGSILTQSARFDRRLYDCAIDVIGANVSPIVNEYWSDNLSIGSDISVAGSVYVDSCVSAKGKVITKDEVVGSDFRYTSTEQSDAIDTASFVVTERLAELSEYITDLPGVVGWLFNNTDLVFSEFYFRTESQYLTSGAFGLFEPSWHQMLRSSGGYSATWQEQLIISDYAYESASWPGVNSLTGASYGIRSNNLTDPATNLSVDRGIDYENAYIAATNWIQLNQNWPVILNPSS